MSSYFFFLLFALPRSYILVLIYIRCRYNLTVVEEAHGSTSVAFSRNKEICAYLTHVASNI